MTTAVVALAVVWPRPVMVVEADRAGGDLAAWLDLSGDCLVRLAAAGRRRLDVDMVRAHAVPLRAGLRDRWALPAPPEAAKARRVWTTLTSAGLPALLDGLEIDVLLDVGRVHDVDFVESRGPMVVVCRPEFDQLAHARALVAQRDSIEKALLLIGDAPYTAGEVAESVEAPVLGVLPVDQRAARALRHGERISARSPLLRAAAVVARTLASSVAPDVDESEAPLAPAGVVS